VSSASHLTEFLGVRCRAYYDYLPVAMLSVDAQARVRRVLRRFVASRFPGLRERASNERVVDVLHVVVLLELVDELERLIGLVLGQLDRRRADVFVSGRNRCDAAPLQRFLHVPEVGE
jgi:hypothetical protein